MLPEFRFTFLCARGGELGHIDPLSMRQLDWRVPPAKNQSQARFDRLSS